VQCNFIAGLGLEIGHCLGGVPSFSLLNAGS
jgi:hypothetical protein